MSDDDPKQIAFETALKAAAWDELRVIMVRVADELEGLRQALAIEPKVAVRSFRKRDVLVPVAAIVLVLVMGGFLGYYLGIANPRYERLNRRIDEITTTTTTTAALRATPAVSTTTTTTVPPTPKPTGSTQSPATTSPPTTTPQKSAPTTTTTTTRPPTCVGPLCIGVNP